MASDVREVSARSLRKAHAVHPIAAVQSEYSLWTRDPEAHVLPACRELGVGFVPFSPIGRAVLTGTIDRDARFESGADMRSTMPRFSGENLDKNLALVEEMKGMAAGLGVAPGQLALAWLLGREEFVVPIPGTKHAKFAEENAGAAGLEIAAEDLERAGELINNDTVAGERYAENQKISLDPEEPEEDES